jgi:hypothetical protein
MFFDVKTMTVSPVIGNYSKVSKRDFYYGWLNILNYVHNLNLSEGEINVLSSVFTKPDDYSWFKKPNCAILEIECKLNPANFKRVVYSLRDKGVVVPTEIKGDFILNPVFAAYKKQLNKYLSFNNKTSLVLNFEVQE